jgi:4'-phosphopantetheinyl transferase
LPTRVRFNISHSDNLAVFAFAVGCDLGVDVERIRTLSDMQHVAERYFCFEEAAQLTSLPMDQRERAFFHCWTRKEAYVKAIGDGLSARLDNFQVTLEQNEPAAFLHLEHDRHAAKGWALHDLKLATNYVAALAYRGTPRHVCILPLIDAAELKQLHFRF